MKTLQLGAGNIASTSSETDGNLNLWLAPYVTNFEPATDKKGKLKLPKGREFRTMICGLAGSGKTMLVMQCEKQCKITWAASLTPVEGQMTMHVHAKNHLILWDMSGTVEGRAAWAQHIEDQDFRALVFVIDCTAKEEMPAAAEELRKLLSHPSVGPNVPLLVLANKQDVTIPDEEKMDAYDVADQLQLCELWRRWRVQECSATLGPGVEQALDWLCMAESTKPRKKETELLEAAADQIIKRMLLIDAYADRKLQEQASPQVEAEPEPEAEAEPEPAADARTATDTAQPAEEAEPPETAGIDEA